MMMRRRTGTQPPRRRSRRRIRPFVLLGGLVGVAAIHQFLVVGLFLRSTTTPEIPLPESEPQQQHRLGPVFYNVFVPPGDPSNALRIVWEQMDQRRWYASDGGDPSPQQQQEPDPTNGLPPVWYTVIGGDHNASIGEEIDTLCQPNCRQIGRFEKGDETDTLHSLWEHCKSHPWDVVTYLHDKGSFHPTAHNEKTRRHNTKAALECRRELAKRPGFSKYNVCQGHMLLLPQWLGQANMWTAKCDYVRGLRNPREYAGTMAAFYRDTIFHPSRNSTDYACLQPLSRAENHLGTGRYANERWILSHPSVVPADVLPARALDTTEFPPAWTPRLGRSLRGSPRAFGMDRGIGESSFARLEGRLLEWDYVYHATPPNASWIWDYYRGFETGTNRFKVQQPHCPLLRPGNTTTTAR